MTSTTNLTARQSTMKESVDYNVAVIGAGPYGLSAAAYLKAGGMSVCVFGPPMDFWANQMPAGMLLRSPRAASNLGDPRSLLTLAAFEEASGLEATSPLPLDTFVSYGRWFQRQIGVSSHTGFVRDVTKENSTFRITLQDNLSVRTQRVVVAAGIGPFAKVPQVFSELPSSQVSHCYEGRSIADFVGKRIAVVGAGQSALESAALLHEAGAQVEVIARIPRLRWIGRHPWLHRLGPVSRMLYSKYDVGPAGISRLVSWPSLVFPIPLKIKDRIRTRAVRPAGSPWLVPRLERVTLTTGRTVQSARSLREDVQLTLDDGTERRVDHVLLGTGYRVDVSGYRFLSPALLSEVARLDGFPMLREGFRSSVPGLHFVGAAAARSFGPLLYFVAGTKFSSNELATYVGRSGFRLQA